MVLYWSARVRSTIEMKWVMSSLDFMIGGFGDLACFTDIPFGTKFDVFLK